MNNRQEQFKASEIYELWQQALIIRLEELRATLPSDLKGIILFSTLNGLGFFKLTLDGVRSRWSMGVCEEPSTYVRVDESRLSALFAKNQTPDRVFLVSGDQQLQRRLFSHLSNYQAKSWLTIRSNP